ncbi:MAG TPA: YeeE/YedE thiosulfate transporter family protein [Longimicrobiales bacterium]|nr:YeeE/YedE thiosulfate transporter family protein [Longimicrobiales bacterium]
MIELMSGTWPWYVAGPIIGIFVPLLLLVGNRMLGISSNFRHICAIVAPGRNAFLTYDWKRSGLWNLVFVAGIFIGGLLAGTIFANPETVIGISEATRADLAQLGITNFDGLVPRELFNWRAILSPAGLLVLGVGGFLVGFGSRWAGGCTSGHAITGLADLQLASLIAVVGFFAGGLFMTFVVLPVIL